MKRWSVIVGGSVVLIFVAGTLLVTQLAKPKPLAPFDQKSAWQSASTKLDEARAQLKQGKAQVTLSQTEVRAVLAEGLGESGAGAVQGVDVNLAPGRLELLANLEAGGRPVSLVLSGNPSVSNGALALKVDRVAVGNLPLPVGTALRLVASQASGVQVDAEAQTLSIPLTNLAIDGQPVTLDNLTLGNGQLTLAVSAR